MIIIVTLNQYGYYFGSQQWGCELYRALVPTPNGLEQFHFCTIIEPALNGSTITWPSHILTFNKGKLANQAVSGNGLWVLAFSRVWWSVHGHGEAPTIAGCLVLPIVTLQWCHVAPYQLL